MSWPLSQDYNEAVQTPAGNFADPDLKSGQVVTNALGLPMPYSGNFADVYQVGCPNGVRWAVKCFTREVPSLRERYEAISRHLRQAKLPFTVDFTYLEKGILVGGGWYPVLKMEWVEGLTLNQFVGQAADKPATLEALLLMWGRLEKYLRGAEVAHADLQHGNVLLVPGSGNNSLALKLVDYDGMWVPALAGGKSGEVGHASYQHPRRLREETYSREVDRFPLLLAATALSGLKARGRALWDKYDNGDNLLFTEADLQAPTKSHLFRDLLHSTDKPTAALATRMIDALQGGLESVPLLEEVMPEAPRPASVRPPSPKAVSPSKAVKVTSVAVGTAPGAAPSPAAGEADAVEVTFVAVGTAPPSGDEALRFDEPPANEAAPAAHSKTTRKKRGGVPVLGWVGGTATLVILAGVAIAMWAFGGWGNGDATNKTPLPPTGVEIDPNPQIVVSFHDTRKNLNYPGLLPGTMRFGLVLRTEAEGGNPKRLTFDQYGCTNNTCLRVDGKDALFGDTRDARWVDRGVARWKDETGQEHEGMKSVWSLIQPPVRVVQTVEVVPGEVTEDANGRLVRYRDTCLVRYLMENTDGIAHTVGLRFLLDTYIGATDGVPFVIPGEAGLCDTMKEFSGTRAVPSYIQAQEHDDQARPGTVAHLQLKLGEPIEPPDRVTLGAWPDVHVSRLPGKGQAAGVNTLWDVRLLPMRALADDAQRRGLPPVPPDSAVVMYWEPRRLGPGEHSAVGFAYGLGKVSASKGNFLLTADGAAVEGHEFAVQAVVNRPTPGQTLTLTLQPGLKLGEGTAAAQKVPPVAPNSERESSTVTWQVRAVREGVYHLEVKSNTGVSQKHPIRVRAARSPFGRN